MTVQGEDHEPQHADGEDPTGVQQPADDRLVEARVALDGVRDLPLEERAEVFEGVHVAVVEELRQLELG